MRGILQTGAIPCVREALMLFSARLGCYRIRKDSTRTQKNSVMKRIIMLVTVVGWMLAASVARAQDPVKVDPKHYTVEFENDAVRVLRIHYGPGEKSVMHSHPAAIAVFLTDSNNKMTFPNGKSEMSSVKAGEVQITPAGEHLPENVGDKPMELILVELKSQTAAK